MTDPKEGTLHWFLEVVVIRDLRQMITSGLRYLSFAVMGSVIELLGAAYDSDDFHEIGVSRKRFDAALQNIPSLTPYAHYRGTNTPHDLYNNMRCGMAHVGKPGKGVVFAERADPTCGRLHLQTREFSGNPRLILVCENLYDDIVKAIGYVGTDGASLKNRLSQRFMDPNLQPDAGQVSTAASHTSG